MSTLQWARNQPPSLKQGREELGKWGNALFPDQLSRSAWKEKVLTALINGLLAGAQVFKSVTKQGAINCNGAALNPCHGRSGIISWSTKPCGYPSKASPQQVILIHTLLPCPPAHFFFFFFFITPELMKYIRSGYIWTSMYRGIFLGILHLPFSLPLAIVLGIWTNPKGELKHRKIAFGNLNC